MTAPLRKIIAQRWEKGREFLYPVELLECGHYQRRPLSLGECAHSPPKAKRRRCFICQAEKA